MKIRNRSGELVELPTHITRDQIDAVLDALGLPKHAGLHTVTVGVWSVSVEAHEMSEDGRPSGAQFTAKLPVGKPPTSEG